MKLKGCINVKNRFTKWTDWITLTQLTEDVEAALAERFTCYWVAFSEAAVATLARRPSRDQEVTGSTISQDVVAERRSSLIALRTSVPPQPTQLWMSIWQSNIGEGRLRNRQSDRPPTAGPARRTPTAEPRAPERKQATGSPSSPNVDGRPLPLPLTQLTMKWYDFIIMQLLSLLTSWYLDTKISRYHDELKISLNIHVMS